MRSKLLTILGLSAVLVTSSGCMKVVDQSEVGIKKDMGKVANQPLSAGTHFYMPLMSTVDTMTIRTKAIDFSKSYGKPNPTYDEERGIVYDRAVRIQTKEKLETMIDAILYYHLNPQKAVDVYVQYGGDGVYDIKLVDGLARGIIRDVIGTTTLTDLISNREKFSKQIQMELTKVLEPKGIVVEKFVIRDIPIPDVLKDAIIKKQKKEEEIQQKRYELEIEKLNKEKKLTQVSAETEARIMKAKAEAESKRLEAEAEAYRIRTINSQLSPGYLEYMRIMTVQNRWNGQLPQTIIGDAKNGIGLLFPVEKK